MKNIVLIGFMGTGKTTTGRLLAMRLGRPFLDIDRKMENETGLSVSDIFFQYGEAAFRQKEAEIIARVSRYSNFVIATGGGAVLFQENIIRLKKNGVLIALTASLEVILERTGRRMTRPLLDRPDRESHVAELLETRRNLYAIADYTVETESISPPQVTDKIIHFLRRGGYLRGRSYR